MQDQQLIQARIAINSYYSPEHPNPTVYLKHVSPDKVSVYVLHKTHKDYAEVVFHPDSTRIFYISSLPIKEEDWQEAVDQLIQDT